MASEGPAVTVTVPGGTQFLFASAIDNLLDDSTDEDGDVGFRIEPS